MGNFFISGHLAHAVVHGDGTMGTGVWRVRVYRGLDTYLELGK
jgi:hypothetical protein